MSTKKAATPKLTRAEQAAARKSSEPKQPISEFINQLEEKIAEAGEEDDEAGKGKIWFILKCYIRGYSRSTIVNEAGFNRSTVYRQCGEYDKLRRAPATHYQGFEVFESRVRRIMSAKGLNREEAVKVIYQKDLE